jgi:hypothetical protein
MARSCIELVAALGRETDGAARAPEAVQASIDAFFDGDAEFFAFERLAAGEDEAPESGTHPAMPLAPAA